MTITAPEWLAKRGATLAHGADTRTWFVLFRGEPQYKLAPVPVAGKVGCAITQTINGKMIESTARADTPEEALRGGLEDLRKALGW
jgi:hypothetical protein